MEHNLITRRQNGSNIWSKADREVRQQLSLRLGRFADGGKTREHLQYDDDVTAVWKQTMASSNNSALPIPPNSVSNQGVPLGILKQVAYWIIAVAAFTGNAILCLFLYSQGKVLFKKPYIVIIFALGLTDVMTAIFLFLCPGYTFAITIPEPKGTSALWLYCQVLYGRMALFMIGLASMNICVILTFERWFAVVKSSQYMHKIDTKRAVLCSVACYILAIVTIIGSSPAVRIHPENPAGKRCSYGKDANLKVTGVVGFLMKSIIPLSIIGGLYLRIIYKMKTGSEVGRQHGDALRKKITKVAAIAILTLMLCWTPNQVTYLLFILGHATQGTTWMDVSVLLVFFNSCVNPVLYGLTMRKYRKGYWSVLTSCCPCIRKILVGAAGRSANNVSATAQLQTTSAGAQHAQ